MCLPLSRYFVFVMASGLTNEFPCFMAGPRLDSIVFMREIFKLMQTIRRTTIVPRNSTAEVIINCPVHCPREGRVSDRDKLDVSCDFVQDGKTVWFDMEVASPSPCVRPEDSAALLQTRCIWDCGRNDFDHSSQGKLDLTPRRCIFPGNNTQDCTCQQQTA